MPFSCHWRFEIKPRFFSWESWQTCAKGSLRGPTLTQARTIWSCLRVRTADPRPADPGQLILPHCTLLVTGCTEHSCRITQIVLECLNNSWIILPQSCAWHLWCCHLCWASFSWIDLKLGINNSKPRKSIFQAGGCIFYHFAMENKSALKSPNSPDYDSVWSTPTVKITT